MKVYQFGFLISFKFFSTIYNTLDSLYILIDFNSIALLSVFQL